MLSPASSKPAQRTLHVLRAEGPPRRRWLANVLYHPREHLLQGSHRRLMAQHISQRVPLEIRRVQRKHQAQQGVRIHESLPAPAVAGYVFFHLVETTQQKAH